MWLRLVIQENIIMQGTVSTEVIINWLTIVLQKIEALWPISTTVAK
jgi:hypothetical protein